MSSDLKLRGPKATPSRSDIGYLSDFAATNDGYISMSDLFALFSISIDSEGRLNLGAASKTLLLAGEMFNLTTEPEGGGQDVLYADQNMLVVRNRLELKTRQIGDGDSANIGEKDCVIDYRRTDAEDIGFRAPERNGTYIEISNGTADAITLKAADASTGYFDDKNVTSDTLTMAANATMAFRVINSKWRVLWRYQ